MEYSKAQHRSVVNDTYLFQTSFLPDPPRSSPEPQRLPAESFSSKEHDCTVDSCHNGDGQ